MYCYRRPPPMLPLDNFTYSHSDGDVQLPERISYNHSSADSSPADTIEGTLFVSFVFIFFY